MILQANRETLEGTSHPDRDAQFGYLNARVSEALAAGKPAISVDTKQKELVGDFKNGGREYRPKVTADCGGSNGAGIRLWKRTQSWRGRPLVSHQTSRPMPG